MSLNVHHYKVKVYKLLHWLSVFRYSEHFVHILKQWCSYKWFNRWSSAILLQVQWKARGNSSLFQASNCNILIEYLSHILTSNLWLSACFQALRRVMQLFASALAWLSIYQCYDHTALNESRLYFILKIFFFATWSGTLNVLIFPLKCKHEYQNMRLIS